MKSPLPDNLKLLKNHIGLKAQGFADKFGVTRQALESYLSGRNKEPNYAFLSAVSNYFGITPGQLLNERLTEEDLRVTGRIKSSTEIRLEAALKRIKDLEEIIRLLKK